MKRSRTVSGASPSATQNARKDVNTSVVRTPPKSTRRPRSCPSGAMGEIPRPLRDLGHALVEQPEERVVGGAREQALVRALEEDSRLPHRERLVPAQLGH